MEEPAFADIDSAEELPIAVEIGMNDAIGRAWRKALELVVQLARAKQRQHHQLLKVGAAARYAGLFADDGMRAIAANGIVGLQQLLSSAAVFRNRDFDAGRILADGFGSPAEPGLHIVELGQPRAQNVFRLVLRQPLILLEIIGIDDFAQRRCGPIFVVEIAIGDNPAHRI